MSDEEEHGAPEKPFHVDRAKTGRAGCKKCKEKIAQGELRFAKLGHNPFGSGTMKLWHHVPCMFEVFKKQRATTKKIESPDEIGGWLDISDEDRNAIMEYFSPELKEVFNGTKGRGESPKKSDKKGEGSKGTKSEGEGSKGTKSEGESKATVVDSKQNSFRAFRKLCADIGEAAGYNAKTKIVHDFFTGGTNGKSFRGDIALWCRLLLPGVVKRVYNIQSKQLVKIFGKILGTSQEEMLEDLEKGDVAETISTFFEASKLHAPASKSTLTLDDVDAFLEALSNMTREEEQTNHFTKIIKKCTSNDLKMIIRLIKHDLRINAGAKHILEGLHPDAYKAFQACRDLNAVVKNAIKTNPSFSSLVSRAGKDDATAAAEMNVNLKLMTPVLPMLAQACKSVEMAMKKCPNGMFSEIKYDGERVQLHKEGNQFKYFSRSLKPVLAHKVNHFKEYIPKAFPHGKDLILDAEILMVDATGKPLPFGTLGIHKKSEFKEANVCLFVFDCIYFNGESLLDTPIKKRKDILRKNMTEIKNRIMLSEMEEIHRAKDLEEMMTRVFKLGLEGLVLKDLKSTYEPGKRHWLKVKKDYLYEGAMADSADLVVVGAWFGTGNKGGIMSIFLMGCYDSATKKWLTVTKVHGGHDDSTLERLQTELDVIKIGKDASKVPSWLKCTKTMVPDFVARDPFKMPVWEITGAEFTQNQIHTADGISIRFPRVTKIRSDKDWTTATSLSQLRELYRMSKDTANFSLKGKSDSSTEESPTKEKKRRKKPADDDDDREGSPSPEKKKKRRKAPGDESTDGESKAEDEESTDVDEVVERDATSGTVIDNPLPDVFLGCVVQMPKDYEESDFLRRYLIAYGAVVYSEGKATAVENSDRKVTHVVHLKKKSSVRNEDSWERDVRHVHVNWLWDSIKLLERQKERNYAVTCT